MLILIITIIIFSSVSSVGAVYASRTPFKVHSFKISPQQLKNNSISNLESLKPGRTRASFFERVLGIRPGEPFDFPLEKWRSIQQSHLFHNITGRTYQADDGIAMEITAIENPSITVKPELAVGLSPSNPDISGGLLIRDRNFRGMGEKMELLISKKEGLEEGVSSLRPLIRLKWADNIIGKDAAFHLQIQREQELENWANFCSLKTDFTNKLSHFSRRVPITTKSIVLHAEKHTDKLRYGFEAYWKKIKGSWIDIGEEPAVQNKVKSEVTGGKFSFNYEDELGNVSGHLDAGASVGTFQGNFLQWGLHVHSNSFNIPGISFPWLRENDRNENEFLGLTASAKLNVVGSEGAGRIPALHLYSGANTHLLRGFPISRRSGCNRLTQILSAQIDTFLPKLPVGKIGLFSDIGLMSVVDVEGLHPLVTTGISARTLGFKLEIASPINKEVAPRLYLGLDV